MDIIGDVIFSYQKRDILLPTIVGQRVQSTSSLCVYTVSLEWFNLGSVFVIARSDPKMMDTWSNSRLWKATIGQ